MRYNELKHEIELEEETLGLDYIKQNLDIDHGLGFHSTNEGLCGIVISRAKKNAYNPIFDYLNECHEKHGGDLSVLMNIGHRHFGTSDPMYTIYLIRFLIGAVKRVFEPGCQHDTVLILKGLQGAKKTTYWETIANKQWFDTWASREGNKDDILRLQQHLFAYKPSQILPIL